MAWAVASGSEGPPVSGNEGGSHGRRGGPALIGGLILVGDWLGGWVDRKTAGIVGATAAAAVTAYLIAGARQATQESFQPRHNPNCIQQRTC